MSKLGLVMVLILMAGRNNAQNYSAPTSDPPTFFVLIQADDGKAFYVRLNNQLYTSSPAGHLILAPLADSVYTITIGFPSFPEQRYLLNIHQRDWSLRLTRQDNRWALYDDRGQALATVTDSATIEKPLLSGAKKDDAFSQLMSAIVQDTAVMYNTFTAASPDSGQATPSATAGTPITHDSSGPLNPGTPISGSPTDTLTSRLAAPSSYAVLSPSTTDTATMKPTGTPATTNPATPAAGTPTTGTPKIGIPISSTIDPAVPSSPTGVVKLSEHKSFQSLSLVYADHPANRTADTIDVVIPIDSPTTALHRPLSPDTSHAAPHKPALPFVNSDCHAFATDYDVDKLRVRMLDATRDEDRIQTAYRTFKTKCFTTNQVRALSEVFTTDPAKFKFLATAYPFVSDDQFSELVNLLSDPVYAGRFRTMTDRH